MLALKHGGIALGRGVVQRMTFDSRVRRTHPDGEKPTEVGNRRRWIPGRPQKGDPPRVTV